MHRRTMLRRSVFLEFNHFKNMHVFFGLFFLRVIYLLQKVSLKFVFESSVIKMSSEGY